MIKGVGIDITEIERIKNTNHLERFVDRILSIQEKALYQSFQGESRKLQFLAGRFAAKEAFSKALGTGIGEVAFKDIIILNDGRGKPYFFSAEPMDYRVHVSISHSNHYAVATVIIE